jgi:hypothetical protein
MGLKRIGRPVRVRLHCTHDENIDFEATYRRLKGIDAEEPLPSYREVLEVVQEAWDDDPSNLNLLVPLSGRVLALFDFRSLGSDDLMAARDMALQLCASGPNWSSRFNFARNVAHFRVALTACKGLFPDETPSSFAVSAPKDDETYGPISVVLENISPDAQAALGRGYLATLEAQGADQGKSS